MMTAPTVLVIEDDPVIRDMVKVILRQQRYDVLLAKDGRTAINLMGDQKPGLILQDLLLPDVDGFTLAKQLRTISGGITPILAISGCYPRVEEGQALNSPFNEYLLKPLESRHLLDVVQSYLPAADLSRHEPGCGRRVLLVEDDPGQAKLIAHHLRALGFQVSGAKDGESALEQARLCQPDAIVSDLLLPKTNGFGLCLSFRQALAFEEIPVVLYTAHRLEEADHELAKDVGASAIVMRGADFHPVGEALVQSLDAAVPKALAHVRLSQDHTARIIRQLERQATQYEGLVRHCYSQTAQLSILTRIAESLDHIQDIDHMMEDILPRYLDSVGSSTGLAYTMDESGTLILRAHLGIPGSEHPLAADRFGESDFLRRLIKQGPPFVLPSSLVPDPEEQRLLVSLGATTLLCTPLTFATHCVGLIISKAGGLNDQQLHFAKSIGPQIGQAVFLSQALTRLTKSERKFRQMAENIQEVFWVTDPTTTRTIYVSPAYESVWGRTCESAYADPRSFLEAIHPEDRGQVIHELERQKLTGAFAAEYRIVRPDGSIRWISDRGFPVRDNDGRLDRVVGVAKDYTERRQAEEALRQSQAQLLHVQKMEAIGRLATGVAHDFNNLLMVITGYSQILEEQLKEAKLNTQELVFIKEATDKAASLTRQLLTFSRQQTFTPEVFDLHSVISNIRHMLARMIGEDIALDIATQPGPCWITADRGQLD